MMTFEEVFGFLEPKIWTSLDAVQKQILRYSWEGKKYDDMGDLGFSLGYIKTNLGPALFLKLTDLLKQADFIGKHDKVTKKNLRSVFEELVKGNNSSKENTVQPILQEKRVFSPSADFSRNPYIEYSKENTIQPILQERRVFSPSADFSRNPYIESSQKYEQVYEQAKADPPSFWAKLAKTELDWLEEWDKVLEWTPPDAKWFVNGKLNVSYNCLDRHLLTSRRYKAAIIWEGEKGEFRILTYWELHREVCQFANVLKDMGVQKGDRIAIYLPMIPEAAIAMLACTRIGAPHSVVFGGLSAEDLCDRLEHAEAKVVVTADGGFRKDEVIPLKSTVDKALENGASTVENVIVVERTKEPVTMKEGRDSWWHDLQKKASFQCDVEKMDSEDPLFILYTSGSTGKPKGVMHTTGGYLLYTHITTKWIFGIEDKDVYWCTADIGWITGHSYVIYGPLSNGATSLMYEGVLRDSNPGCLWDVIEKYSVNIFYTTPTNIRACMKKGEDLPRSRNLSSLRLLGTVGESINPEAWMWYHQVIGGERCPIVDTWWQTETGGIMISPVAGATPTIKPGATTRPFPGIIADIVDQQGNRVPDNIGGYLVIKDPWPGMLRMVYKESERFRYWNLIRSVEGQSLYFTGDYARRDEHGDFWILGRVEDAINVSGQLLSCMELESAFSSYDAVAEASVVGVPHEVKGEDIYAFVILKDNYQATPEKELREQLQQHVITKIGRIAGQATIEFVEAVPNTQSGKILRRFLRQIAANQDIRPLAKIFYAMIKDYFLP